MLTTTIKYICVFFRQHLQKKFPPKSLSGEEGLAWSIVFVSCDYSLCMGIWTYYFIKIEFTYPIMIFAFGQYWSSTSNDEDFSLLHEFSLFWNSYPCKKGWSYLSTSTLVKAALAMILIRKIHVLHLKVETRCVCETQMPPIMANIKDGNVTRTNISWYQ